MLSIRIDEGDKEYVFEASEVHTKHKHLGATDHKTFKDLSELYIIMPDGSKREMLAKRHEGHTVYAMNEKGQTVATYRFPVYGKSHTAQSVGS